MQGASRVSLANAQERLSTLLSGSSVDATSLSEDLFAATGAFADSPSLRRALTDPSRDGQVKATLVERLFNGRVSGAAVDLLAGLVRGRWSATGDLTDATEQLAVSAALASAEAAGRLDDVEDELFRFSRTVSSSVGLRDAFSTRTEGADRKAELVQRLLGRQAAPETVRLATQAAVRPRGLRTERVLESYVEAAAERRRQLVAQVTAATPLTVTQRERLAASLQRLHGRPVRLNIDIDPEIIGGIRVVIDNEVYDGSVASKLDDARRRLAG